MAIALGLLCAALVLLTYLAYLRDKERLAKMTEKERGQDWWNQQW